MLLGLRIKTLRVRSLQSMKDITVSFSERGVFKLDGNNNIGKSALSEAIRILAKNVSNNNYKYYLRDGCTNFVIDYEGWDGSKITLSRGSVDFYEWELADGKKGRADKTGGRVPAELEEYFNLYHEKEKTKEILNFRMKDSLIPFVEMTAGDNNFILQKALGTEDFLLALKSVQKIKNEESKEVKVIETQLDQETERLQTITASLTQKERSLAEVERYEAVLKAEYEILEGLEDVKQAKQVLNTEESRLNALKSRVTNLPIEEGETILALLQDVQDLQGAMKHLSELEKEYESKKARVTGLETEEGEEILVILQDIQELQKEIHMLAQIETELSSLKARLESVSGMEEVEELLACLNDIKEMQEAYRQLHVLENQTMQAKEQYEQAQKELEQLKEEMGVCPLCGVDIHQEHLHSAV
ncbi:hypothetical protein [Bacillus thuringiensis]|uniref:hypothetical protein n=1 Tax=Bacillus thuringiensis TaxID=1428 RepID=UPI000BFE0386|nr:hypothetical protein [Bacillus thuringiensis]PGT89938.1 hypothetical protein COD17_09315 [Bacillus thuringiensis]